MYGKTSSLLSRLFCTGKGRFKGMELLEIYSRDGAGFFPLVLAENWQVAFLNFSADQLAESIKKIDRHLQTDEVFVLLDGQAILIVAEEMASGLSFICQPMLPQKIYNVSRNVWHNIVLGEKGKVLIVENRDTHLGDFEYRQLIAVEYDNLQKCLQDSIANNL